MTPEYLKVTDSAKSLVRDLTVSEARKFKDILTSEHKDIVTRITYKPLHEVAALQGAANSMERLIDNLTEAIGK